MKHFRKSSPYAGLALLIITSLSSCDQNKGKEETKDAPPASFKVIEITNKATTLIDAYPASIQGSQDIEIRPKIDGYIETILVDEGTQVRKGQLLFKINNRQYDEAVASASAAISGAEADVANARLQVAKTKPLVEQDIISPYELEAAQHTLKARESALAQLKTTLANAKVNLGYASVTSPVDGVVGTIPLRTGSYVSSSTPLTVVSSIGKVYAYFSMNEKQQLSLFKGGNAKQAIGQLPPVKLLLADGSAFPETGKIETFSGQANTTTGSFNVRAGFQNQNGLLRSGSSVTIQIPTDIAQALVVPQSATYELQGKRFVYVVSADNTVTAKEIKTREIPGGQLFVVDSGLAPGEKVVIEGIAKLSEGTKIAPVAVPADSIINR